MFSIRCKLLIFLNHDFRLKIFFLEQDSIQYCIDGYKSGISTKMLFTQSTYIGCIFNNIIVYVFLILHVTE